MSNPLFIKAPFLTRKNFFNTNKTNNVFCLIYPFYLFETTFQREATSDLTGERGSLMGAIQSRAPR